MGRGANYESTEYTKVHGRISIYPISYIRKIRNSLPLYEPGTIRTTSPRLAEA